METALTIAVTPFLKVFFEKLIESILQLNSNHGLKKEVERLKQIMLTICSIHDDVEKRQMEGDANLKTRLQHLKEELYNARDVLEEITYEYQRRQHTHVSQVRNSSVIRPFNLKRILFEENMSSKIIQIRETLRDLLDQSSHFNQQRKDSGRPESISVGDKNVFGRDEDSETILNFLLSNDVSKANVNFITVYGKAGIGKTTLAHLVFNHERVMRHFHIRMWVHASYQDDDNDINAKALIKATIESITGKGCDLQRLDAMRHHLQMLLEQKKYLLVLDDMMNDKDDFLRVVKTILILAGAHGSKVLITTQNRSINTLMRPTHTHELKSISRDDCARVIKEYAFWDQSPDTHRRLNSIIEKIVDRCNGFPSIAEKYGMLLMKTEREEWESISNKEVAEAINLNNYISQILPSDVKRCLGYCSIFPKNFKFDKEQLARQWWAQGFVSAEDEVRKCFDLMINWSLLQYTCFDPSKKQQTYIMHDDGSYTAQSIAGEECYMMHAGSNHRISEITHHCLLLNPCESSNSPGIESIYEAKNLHTLILLGNPMNLVRIQVPENLPNKLQSLRTLDLSHVDLHKLPSSIGDLKHLSYLAVCNTKIKRLPNSVSKLYLLQSLVLRNCYELLELPKNISNLTNLIHLDLHLDDDFRQSGRLRSMPQKMRNLVNLKTLSRFVVSKNARCGIDELGDMCDLRGHLVISSLEHVNNAVDSREAALQKKEHLQMLELQWGEDARDLHTDENVLEYLKPHAHLKELRIGGCRDCFMPMWIGDKSFSRLESMKLYNCKNLSTFPQLGELPSLKKLQLERLPKWRSWDRSDDCKFASLTELVLRDCNKLSQLSPDLPVLDKLEIELCPNIIGLPRLPSLHYLKVKDSGDWIWDSLCCLNSLNSLVLSGLPTTTPTWQLKACTRLQRLEINNCRSLNSLVDDWLPTTLTSLKVEHCSRLDTLPSGLKNLKYLEELQIQHCEELLSLPMGMKGLKFLSYFELSDCPKLSCMPGDGLPAELHTISISSCPKLESWLRQERDITASIQSVWINGNLQTEASCSGASTSQGI